MVILAHPVTGVLAFDIYVGAVEKEDTTMSSALITFILVLAIFFCPLFDLDATGNLAGEADHTGLGGHSWSGLPVRAPIVTALLVMTGK